MTSPTAPVPGPGILDIAPYVGGESKIPGVNRIVKLSSNEGAFGPPPGAIEAIRAMAAEAHRYPDGNGKAIREAIGARFGLEPELTAKVAHLRLAQHEVPHAARLLGRLYDAIECDDLPAQLAIDLERDAGVPVFNGLGGPEHASCMLARMMSSADASADEVAENRHYVLQAMLVRTLA